MRRLALLGVLLALTGCGKNLLRPDVVIPATHAKYPSAEFTACGQIWNGLGFCVLDEGRDLNDVTLKVQGYYRGTVKFSTNCELDSDLPLSLRYNKSQEIPFFVPGPAVKTCGISFVVSPEYPKEQDQKLVIHSFKGHLLIKIKKPDQDWIGHASKVKAGIGPSNVFRIPVQTVDKTVNVSFLSDRCDVSKDLVLDVVDGSVTVPLRDLLPEVLIQNCILNGVVFTSESAIRTSWIVAGYDPRFIPLPIPVTHLDGDNLEILADDNVSIISLDGRYCVDNETEFDFDPAKHHLIRILTVGGRLALGVWTPGEGFEWIL